jgi:hypothetical protein
MMGSSLADVTQLWRLSALVSVFLSLAALSIKSPVVVFKGGLDQGQKPSSAIDASATHGRLWISIYQGIL